MLYWQQQWGSRQRIKGTIFNKNIFHIIFSIYLDIPSIQPNLINLKVTQAIKWSEHRLHLITFLVCCVSNDYISVDDDIHVLRSLLAGTKTENQQLGRGVGRGQDRAHERKKNTDKCLYYVKSMI